MIVEIIPTRRPSIVVLVKPNMKFSDRNYIFQQSKLKEIESCHKLGFSI